MRRIVGLSGLPRAFLCFAVAAAPRSSPDPFKASSRMSRERCCPGATVEARTRWAASTRSSTSLEGVYRFPALPPGTYELTATLQGFRPAKLPNTVLELGKNLTIEMAMEVASLTETVSVTAESSPIIDVKGNTVSATFTKATIDRMPKGRDFTTILRQAPGAQR